MIKQISFAIEIRLAKLKTIVDKYVRNNSIFIIKKGNVYIRV